MNWRTVILFVVTVTLLALLSARVVTLAQTSANYDLTWNVIAGSGGVSASASYRVAGTVGQAMTGPPAAASSSFRLNSGFWIPVMWKMYLPLVLR